MSGQIKDENRKKNTSKGLGLSGIFLIYFLISLMIIIAGSYFVITKLSTDLPDHKQLETKIINQTLSTFIYSSDGVLLRTLSEKEGKRFWATYNEIPQHTIDAFLAAEDSRYYQHWGVSLRDIARAMVANIKATRIRFSKKFPYIFDFTIEQGASTITQQLARDIFLDRKKTFKRKFKEMIVAVKVENTYSKPEILEFFLNRMKFGNRSLGIQAASNIYFGKNASELDVGESAMLAGLLQGTTKFNPYRGEKGMASATNQRNKILRMMVNIKKISRVKAREEMEKPIELFTQTGTDYGKAPFFVWHVHDILSERYGEDVVDTEGLRVYTTLDYRLQRIAEEVFQKQLEMIQKNYADQLPYERPEGLSQAQAVEDSLKKTRVQGALIALDVKTGKVLAMIGGREFDYFNRAIDANRHAGSLFKPFVYTSALDNGWRCCDVIRDSYVKYLNPDGFTYWEPENFTKQFLGPLSVRQGFTISQNIIAIKLMNDTESYITGGPRAIGPRTVIQYARKMGITTPLDAVPSLSIGTSPVKLIEMVSAYTIFPNHGIKTEPFFIDRIYDKNNTLIFRQLNSEGAKREALSPAVASLMLTMFEGVTSEGTASGIIKWKEMSDRPCGGKTGTGNEYKDAWFIGFTPYIACGVWVGFDSEETTLGDKTYGTGATAALPIWVDFIKQASEVMGYSNDRFTYKDITTMLICKDSYKRATAKCPEDRTYFEYFIPGTEITEFCDIHGSEKIPQDVPRFIPAKPNRRRGF